MIRNLLTEGVQKVLRDILLIIKLNKEFIKHDELPHIFQNDYYQKDPWQVCGEKRNLYTVGEDVNWCSCHGKQYGAFSKN